MGSSLSVSRRIVGYGNCASEEMAVEVKAEVSDSRDVTDEYFDLRARLDNQKATEEALLKLWNAPRMWRPR